MAEGFVPCPFHKGDRVEFTHPSTGKVVTGTVKNVLPGNRISILTDDRLSIKWGWIHFRKSTTQAPPKQHNPFTAGDRVTWAEGKGKCLQKTGTVRSVRDERISVDIDNEVDMVVRGHFSIFSKVAK